MTNFKVTWSYLANYLWFMWRILIYRKDEQVHSYVCLAWPLIFNNSPLFQDLFSDNLSCWSSGNLAPDWPQVSALYRLLTVPESPLSDSVKLSLQLNLSLASVVQRIFPLSQQWGRSKSFILAGPHKSCSYSGCTGLTDICMCTIMLNEHNVLS